MIEHYKNLSLESLFYINPYGLICQEEWRDVVGYEGIYQVSNLGRVKSLKFKKEKILKGSLYDTYRMIGLSVNGKVNLSCVHVLVAVAFLGHIPCGHKIVVDHIVNKNRLDNSVFNLQLIKHRENDSKDTISKSGFVGIQKTKNNKFRVDVNLDKPHNMGVFDSIEIAIEVRKKAIELYEKGEDFLHLKSKRKINVRAGVYKNIHTFYARISVNGKNINLGFFKTKEEAYEARRLALIKHGIIEP